MKKTMRSISVLLLAMFVVLSAAACGDRSNSKFVGSWSLVINQDTLSSMTEEEASVASAFLSTMSFNLTISADGTATADGSMITASSDASAKWTEDGDTLTLTDPSGKSTKTMVLHYKDGKLYFDEATMGEDTKYFYLQKK